MLRRQTILSVFAAVSCLGVLGGCGSASQTPPQAVAVTAVTTPPPAASAAASPSTGSGATDETSRPSAGAATSRETPAAGAYVTYDAYQKNPAAATGKIVLFFHAGWCPTCQEAERNLTSAPVPAGVTIVKVDFDNSSDLRQRYGVTVQHTFVQVDPSGAQLAKWSGSSDAVAILRKTV